MESLPTAVPRCPLCQKPFDLVKRNPCLHSCCGDATCKECWSSKFVEGKFQCHNQCDNYATQDMQPQQPKTAICIKRLIENQPQPSYIICSDHPNQFITEINYQTKKLSCPECRQPQINTIKINRRRVEYATKTLYDKMEQKVQEIRNDQAQLQSILDLQEIKSQEYSELVTRTQKYLGYQDSDHCLFFGDELPQVIGQTVLLQNPESIELLKTGFRKNYRLELIYRASRDGFEPEKYKAKYHNIPQTLCLIKSEHNLIFGGYTSLPWKDTQEYLVDQEAFIFSLSKNTIHEQINKSVKCHYNHSALMFLFHDGNNGDFYIYDNCHQNQSSYTDFGKIFKSPNGIVAGTPEAQSYLAGSYKFKVVEIEVFKVQFI